MSAINFNAQNVAPNVGFAPVPKGKYTVIMYKSEFKPTANGAGKIIEFRNQVQGGEYHGRDIMFNVNWENQSAKAVEIGHGQFSAICHAVGVMQVQDTQQLHNIPFSLTVDVTPDGKYNDIIAIEPVQAAGQSAPNLQQPAAPVQPALPQGQYPQPPQAEAPPQQATAPLPPSQPAVAQSQPVPQPPLPVQPAQPAPVAPGMEQYEQMAQPPAQQQVAQPIAQPQPAPAGDVPPWIANQQQQQQQQQG